MQEALEFLFLACKETQSICELQEGTLLGAVKLGTILPWEKDADIMILSDHFNQLLKYMSQHEGPGTLESVSYTHLTLPTIYSV